MDNEADPNFTVAAGPALPRFWAVPLGVALAVCHQIVTSLVHDAGKGVNFARFCACNPWEVNGISESTPAWIRTKDQLIKSQLLYQLSYRGVALYRCPAHPQWALPARRRRRFSKSRGEGNGKM